MPYLQYDKTRLWYEFHRQQGVAEQDMVASRLTKPAATAPIPLVLLHGFAQSSRTWDEVVPDFATTRPVLTIDLVGHGKSDRPRELAPYEEDFLCKALEAIFARLDFRRIILLGYSMGGRMALAYTRRFPQRISRLILESAAIGSQTDEERQERKAADLRLAHDLGKWSIEEFTDYWEALPLFESQRELPPELRARVRGERLGNSPHALAFTIQGSGQGLMSDYFPMFENPPLPVLYLAGLRDKKYAQLARQLAKRLQSLPSVTVRLMDAGHNIHLEAPGKFVETVQDFCKRV